MEDIPKDLVFNWDQTGMSTWTMEKKGIKHVKIAALNDKRLITAVFGCSISGKFFPIYSLFTKGLHQNAYQRMSTFQRIGISHVPKTTGRMNLH